LLYLWVVIPAIEKFSLAGTEFVFESDKAIMIEIGTPVVDRLGPPALALFDQLPEQKRHPPQMMKPLIRTTVLVDDRGTVSESKHGGHRFAVFAGYSDLEIVAQTTPQISEPGSWLGK
jgi:hypothetical protein